MKTEGSSGEPRASKTGKHHKSWYGQLEVLQRHHALWQNPPCPVPHINIMPCGMHIASTSLLEQTRSEEMLEAFKSLHVKFLKFLNVPLSDDFYRAPHGCFGSRSGLCTESMQR